MPVPVSVEYVKSILTRKELGKGFFGIVYEGSDTIINRKFAVKTIPSDLLRQGRQEDLKSVRRSFQRQLDVSGAVCMRWLFPTSLTHFLLACFCFAQLTL